jgi:hypothetical protein
MTTQSKKGAPIKFIGGDYVGCSGWINKMKDPMDTFIYVIVVLKKTKKELLTRVKQENYVLLADIKVPINYEEAMVQQHPDIEQMLNMLAGKMAECELIGVTGQSGQNIGNVFLQHLGKAIARQNAKDSKSRWRRVRWSP